MNLDIKLDPTSELPIYQQITDQIKQLVASGRLKQGDRLPTIREMASTLGVNQNTVARAYQILQQEDVIIARPRLGATIAAHAGDRAIGLGRNKRLTDIINDDIIRVLSLGYSPDEIETSFHLQLARWLEQRQHVAEGIEAGQSEAWSENAIRFVGSNDLALDILVDLLKRRNSGIEIQVNNTGSLGGLIALHEGRANLAGVHLLDEETEEYNIPYIKRLLPGTLVTIVHFVDRIQGLMFQRSNPKRIKGIADLARPDISLINRQKGAGTRVLLDIALRRLGILPSQVRGYDRETDTHMSAGIRVAQGEADAALGIEAAARVCDLGFLPLFRERYDLVMPRAEEQRNAMAQVLRTMASDEYRAVIDQMGGYDTTETGRVSYL